jgi:uncharacterized protein
MNEPSSNEQAVSFRCGGEQLWGIVTRAPLGVAEAPAAVVIAVGGPQYRVGSHRQFVLLARRLAQHGFPSLRFDCRGMGDSEGAMRSFEDTAPDLHAAVDTLRRACPAARQVVVWGLCDAASAALMHATSHPDVRGIVAANPWARSAASLAATHVKHYYAKRLLQREFWAKLMRGGIDWRSAGRTLHSNVRLARGAPTTGGGGPGLDMTFQARMARGLAAFDGRVLLILAANDLTAREFIQYAQTSAAWRGLLGTPRVARVDVPLADHTFSCRAWRSQVEEATIQWLQTLVAAERQ